MVAASFVLAILLLLQLHPALTYSYDHSAATAPSYPSHWRALLAAPTLQHVNLDVLLEHVCTSSDEPSNAHQPKKKLRYHAKLVHWANKFKDPSLKKLSTRQDVMGDTYVRGACPKYNFGAKKREKHLVFMRTFNLDGLGHVANTILNFMVEVRTCDSDVSDGADRVSFLQPSANEQCTWLERVTPSLCMCVCKAVYNFKTCRRTCGTCSTRALAEASRDHPSIVYLEEQWTDNSIHLNQVAGLVVPGVAGGSGYNGSTSLYCHERGPADARVHRKLHTAGLTGLEMLEIYECNYMPPLDSWFMFESIAKVHVNAAAAAASTDGTASDAAAASTAGTASDAAARRGRRGRPGAKKLQEKGKGELKRKEMARTENVKDIIRQEYAKAYQSSRRGIVPCGRQGGSRSVPGDDHRGGTGTGVLRPYEVALHLRLGDLLSNKRGSLSDQDFGKRAKAGLSAFLDALSIVAQVSLDAKKLAATGNVLHNARTPSSGSTANYSSNPHAHVLIVSDSSPAVIATQLVKHNVRLEVVREWNDGVSDLTTSKLSVIEATDHQKWTPITVDFLTSGNPLVALHCLSSADILIAGDGNFATLAGLMALAPPYTTRVALGSRRGRLRWEQKEEELTSINKLSPQTLFESNWFEAERRKQGNG